MAIMGAIMPTATLNMVRIDRRLRQSLQLQLYTQVRQAIIYGELTAGVRLPSTRDLVEQLRLSRNTIVYAFERLIAEGLLESRIGSGMYVAQLPAINNLADPKTGGSQWLFPCPIAHTRPGLVAGKSKSFAEIPDC